MKACKHTINSMREKAGKSGETLNLLLESEAAAGTEMRKTSQQKTCNATVAYFARKCYDSSSRLGSSIVIGVDMRNCGVVVGSSKQTLVRLGTASLPYSVQTIQPDSVRHPPLFKCLTPAEKEVVLQACAPQRHKPKNSVLFWLHLCEPRSMYRSQVLFQCCTTAQSQRLPDSQNRCAIRPCVVADSLYSISIQISVLQIFSFHQTPQRSLLERAIIT